MRRILLVLTALTLSIAGACGGGGGDVDVASDSQADAKADEAAGKDVDTEFSGKGGKDFCEYLKEVIDRDDLSVSGSASQEEQAKKAKEALAVFEELEAKAPSEIKADVKTVVDGIRPFFNATAENRQPTEAETKASQAGQAEFQAASARVEAYGEKVCGIKDEEEDTTTTAVDDPASGGDDGTSGDEQAPAEETTPPEE